MGKSVKVIQLCHQFTELAALGKCEMRSRFVSTHLPLAIAEKPAGVEAIALQVRSPLEPYPKPINGLPAGIGGRSRSPLVRRPHLFGNLF